MKYYIKKYLPSNCVVWFMGVITSVLKIALAYVSMYALNAVVQKNLQLFLKYIVILLIGYIVMFSINYIFEIIRAKTVQKILAGIRTDVANTMTKCSYSSFHKQNSANYLSWFENDVNMIEVNGLVALFVLILHVVTIVIAIIALYLIHPILAGFSVVMSLVLIFLPKCFTKMIEKATIRVSEEVGSFTGTIQDSLLGFDTLFAFNKRNLLRESVNMASKKRAKAFVNVTQKYAISGIAIAIFTMLFNVIMMGFTGALVIKGFITVGAVLASGKIATSMAGGLSQISGLIIKIKSVKPLFEKIQSLPQEKDKELQVPSFNKNLELKNLSFNYDDSEKKILNNLNMKFEIGKKYGIKGESGSGKTTMFKLLTGMLDNSDGGIFYDGKNITELNKNQLRENVSYIDQNVYIFNKTIRENLCLGDEFSEQEISTAIKNACLEPVIAECENGLNTMVAEHGSNFSGGQRQRIALARALLHNRKILLIDEGTSALDKKNAQEIENTLLNNPDLTVIMVSHHFSEETLQKFDALYEI